MKQTILTLAALIACLGLTGLTGCKPDGPTRQQLVQSNDSLLTLTLKQSNDLADLMQTLNDVAAELDQINGTIPLASGDERQRLQDRRDDLLTSLAQVRAQIADKQAQIDQLQSKYGALLSQNKELKRTVDRLQKDIADYQDRIAAYGQEVAEKAAQIEALQEDLTQLGDSLDEVVVENAGQAAVISEQDKMLNRGYYIFGTKRELKDRDLIVSGVFKASRINEKGFNTSAFTQVDIRDFKSLDLGRNKVRILSPVPENSYTLDVAADGTTHLVVTDAPAFWSLTRFLVILIK